MPASACAGEEIHTQRAAREGLWVCQNLHLHVAGEVVRWGGFRSDAGGRPVNDGRLIHNGWFMAICQWQMG